MKNMRAANTMINRIRNHGMIHDSMKHRSAFLRSHAWCRPGPDLPGYAALMHAAFFFLLFSFSLPCLADSPGQDLAVLDIGYGASGLSQGGAVIARTQDAFSHYWNPAGIAFIPISTLGHSFTELDMGITYYGLSWLSKTGKGAWVMGWNAMAIEDLEITEGVTDEFGQPVIDPQTGLQEVRVIGTFDTSDHVISLGYAMKTGTKDRPGAIGAVFKGIIRDMYNESASGLGLDLGAVFPLNNSLRAGLVISDVGQTHVDWSTGSQDIVRSCLRAGLAWETRSGLGLEVDMTTQITGYNPDPPKWSLGGQWAMGAQLFLRAGLKDEKLSLGAGFRTETVRFDMAYVEIDDFQNPITISLSMDLKEE